MNHFQEWWEEQEFSEQEWNKEPCRRAWNAGAKYVWIEYEWRQGIRMLKKAIEKVTTE